MKRKHYPSELSLIVIGVMALGMGCGPVQAKVSSTYTGSITIGYESTCNAGNAGMLRYNSASGAAEYCNGSGWMTMISGSANTGGAIGGSGGVLLRLTNGTAAAPSLTFLSDIKTGLYYVAGPTLNFTTNGVQRMVIDANGYLNLNTAGTQYQIGGTTVLRVPNNGADLSSLAMGPNASASLALGNGYTATIGTDAMRYETGSDNVAIGYYAGQGISGTPESGGLSTIVGDYALQKQQGAAGGNIAIGYQANAAETVGTPSVVIGHQAGLNAYSQGGHTMVGAYAGNGITTGFVNTIVGANAVAGSVSGTGNYFTAIGYGSFYSASSESTGVGYQAGYYDSGWDTAFGVQALYGASASIIAGQDNTAAGDQALYSGRSALAKSTAVGYQALYGVTTGTGNTGLGYQAGYAGTPITTGTNDTFVGYQAQSNGAAYTNGTAIGNGAVLRASNSITFGNASVTTIYGQPSGITNTSDRREKKDIKALSPDLGLDFVGRLTPVSYRLRNGSEILHYGLIAQDMEKVLPVYYRTLAEKPNSGSLFGLLNRNNDKQKYYNLNYMELISPIVLSLQQQEKQIEDARKELESVRQEHDDLVQAINDNLKAIKALSDEGAALDKSIMNKSADLTKGERK